LGSMVQKGKFAAWAFPFSQRALNSVDCTDAEPCEGFQQRGTQEPDAASGNCTI
jgi:hypothetical protein